MSGYVERGPGRRPLRERLLRGFAIASLIVGLTAEPGGVAPGWAAKAAEPPAVASGACEPPPVVDEPPVPEPIRIGPAEAPPPELRRRMAGWHRGYGTQMEAVKRAWLAALRLAAARRALVSAPECRALGRSLHALEVDRLFRVPDPLAERHLVRALRELAQAADSCRKGRYFDFTWRLEAAALALADLRRQLALYGLEP